MIISRTPFRISFLGGGTDYPAWYTEHGGFNQILFHQSGEISVIPITIGNDRLKELDSYLMLLYTGIRRTASDVVAT